MTKLLTSIIILLFSLPLFSQSKKVISASIADCAGAMNIFKSGSYSIQFTGSKGDVQELANYPSLSDISDDNLVWISYIAETDGVLSFSASVSQDFIQMVIFEETKSNVCLELENGTAEIKRLFKGKDALTTGLDKTVTRNVLYPLTMVAGQKIVIAFSTAAKSKASMKLNFKFESNEENFEASNETKIIDQRNDEFAPSLTIMVRDSETNEPIMANITIEGAKDLAALYKASDMYFNVNKSGKISIRCDAEGYFFIDQEESLIANSNQEILLKMERVKKGRSIQIEEIEFKPGTSEFQTGSESKLRRLKDFMALNSDINIEIQGHVFSTGDNGVASQKLSEARAKRVLIYLAENGISKERMIAVGYGNTRPIYPDAKLAYEEQANRRVEILVK